MIQAICLDDEATAKIEKLKAFAYREENFYRPTKGYDGPFPGENENYIVQLGDFRVVFSITVIQDHKFRHLSISTPGQCPHEVIIEAVAQKFDFTGKVDDWLCEPNPVEECMVVVQDIAGKRPTLWYVVVPLRKSPEDDLTPCHVHAVHAYDAEEMFEDEKNQGRLLDHDPTDEELAAVGFKRYGARKEESHGHES